MMGNPVPNLVILGAQKSGTTSLHRYLGNHPAIFMSNPLKEPGYFWGEKRALGYWKKKGKSITSITELLNKYMLDGYRGEPYFGDASTFYTISDYSRRYNIPKRMYDASPAMKFIYILRNPFERIVSNYLHFLKHKRQAASLEEFCVSPEGKAAVLTSRYHWQASKYLEVFDASRFCLLSFESMVSEPTRVLRKISEFLDLEPFNPAMEYPALNVSKHRLQLDHSELRFTPRQFRKIRHQLSSDTNELLALFPTDLPEWDMSEETWCMRA